MPSMSATEKTEEGQVLAGDTLTAQHVEVTHTSIVTQDDCTSHASTTLGVSTLPVAKLQRLETHMAKLLQHLQPWMQTVVEESETRMKVLIINPT